MKGLTVSLVVSLMLLAIAVHALAILGPALILRFLLWPLLTMNTVGFALGIAGLMADLLLVLPLAVLTTGAVSRLLRLRYSGVHEFDLRDPDVRNWLRHMTIYLPTAVVLDFLHAYPLKTLHARLFGAHIAHGVTLAGLILDPSLTTIGAGTHVGGFVVIFGHSAETHRGRIIFAPVTIGAHCGIGARAMIMPGAVMEDGSCLGPQSLLIQSGRLSAGATYLGVPSRRIIETRSPSTVENPSEVVSCI
jgi:hypothetical protein